MHTLTKADIISTLSHQLNIDTELAREILENFFDLIVSTLSKGEEVKLSGFGNFVILHKKERVARNPKTGEAAVVSARSVISYHPSVTLKGRFEALADTMHKDASNKSKKSKRAKDKE